MNFLQIDNLEQYCLEVAQRARIASAELATITGQQKNKWLCMSAAALRHRTSAIITANARDLDMAPDYGLTDAQIDRLRLTPQRVEEIALALEQVAMLPDPVGNVISSQVRPNGLDVMKIRVPLGVVFFIYESRPNVTADAAALCVKSGNAVILRGGKEAMHSSLAIAKILSDTALEAGIPANAIQLVQTSDRSAVGEFLKLSRYIDVCIPRGGEGLIRRVCAEAKMPVIKHFDGNCHVYIDASAPPRMARDIVLNAKCHRMGVCNAAESLVVHQGALDSAFPEVAAGLLQQGVEIFGDEETCRRVPAAQPATDEDFRAEYLAPKISCKIVASLDEAIRHINEYGSGHTETIITSDLASAREFTTRVDSSAVMVNASTRFNDGGEFGLGAEIGISTDKFHARGPCGLEELTSYKYVVYGDGHVRK